MASILGGSRHPKHNNLVKVLKWLGEPQCADSK